MKTREDLCNWLKDNAEFGNSVWVVYNGGGITLIHPDDINVLISDIMGSDYLESIEHLSKGEEFPDFQKTLSEDEYIGTDCFYRVCHDTGYNQENIDIQVQYWE